MKWENLIQGVVILSGLFIGAHFSKLAYAEHEKLGHTDLKAHAAMSHGNLDVSKEPHIPKIDHFQVIKDPMSGWNINVQVSNFRFAPELASQPHQPGEGHAHLYINGKKIARLYGNWFHIPELIKGQNEFKVTLNSNDHQTLVVNEQPIQKIIQVIQ